MTPEPISKILKTKELLTVNSTVNSNKDIYNTVNSNVDEKFLDLEKKTNDYLEELQGNPEYIADKLSRELDDKNSYRYFLVLAKNTKSEVLLDVLSCTMSAFRDGRMRIPRAKYFMTILRIKGIKIKFK